MSDKNSNNDTMVGVMDSWEDHEPDDKKPDRSISPRPRAETDLELKGEGDISSEDESSQESIAPTPEWVVLQWRGKEIIDRRKIYYNECKERYEYVLEHSFLRKGQYVSDNGDTYWKWEGVGNPKYVALKWVGENVVEKRADLTLNTIQGKYEYPSSIRSLHKGQWVSYEDDNTDKYFRWGDEDLDVDFPLPTSERKSEPPTRLGKMNFSKNSTKMRLGAKSKKSELESDDGSIDGRRTEAFDALADKTGCASELLHTRMCRSLEDGVECPHGSECRFAHSQNQLRLTDCVFKDECRFVKCNASGIYFNTKPRPGVPRKVCRHLHPDETRENYMNRTGIDKFAPVDAPVASKQRSRVFSPRPKISTCVSVRRSQPTSEQIQQMQALRIAELEAELDAKWTEQENEEDNRKAAKENEFLLKEATQPRLPDPSIPRPQGMLLAPAALPPPPPPPPKTVAEKPTASSNASDDTLVIRVPPDQYMMALEMAMKSGRGKVQVEIM
jgi:hypothetical protein